MQQIPRAIRPNARNKPPFSPGGSRPVFSRPESALVQEAAMHSESATPSRHMPYRPMEESELRLLEKSLIVKGQPPLDSDARGYDFTEPLKRIRLLFSIFGGVFFVCILFAAIRNTVGLIAGDGTTAGRAAGSVVGLAVFFMIAAHAARLGAFTQQWLVLEPQRLRLRQKKLLLRKDDMIAYGDIVRIETTRAGAGSQGIITTASGGRISFCEKLPFPFAREAAALIADASGAPCETPEPEREGVRK